MLLFFYLYLKIMELLAGKENVIKNQFHYHGLVKVAKKPDFKQSLVIQVPAIIVSAG